MNFWDRIQFEYIPQINILFGLLFHRILYAAFVLSVLIGLIMLVRKKLAPAVRSWLWGICIPALLIPFEHGIVAIIRSIFTPHLSPEIFLYFLGILQNILPYLWLAGFIVSTVKLRKDRNNTIRLLHTGQLRVCAAFFHKGRSHIYLPPDFESTYTITEREMMLAHEKQHIIHHDPLLYRFLQTIQCVFWFNPLVHKAVKYIRHDRELLCDEHAIRDGNRREYGLLLLREAQKGTADYILPCLASEEFGVYERVAACVKPFSKTKKNAVLITGFAVVLYMIGLIGFVKPIVNTPMDIWVSIINDSEFVRLEGAERYVVLKPDGIGLDRKGLIDYAESIGLESEQSLKVSVFEADRLTLTSSYTVCGGGRFTVKELETENIFFPYYDTGVGKFWGLLFKFL